MRGFDNLVFLRDGLRSGGGGLLALSPGLRFPHSCSDSAEKIHFKILLEALLKSQQHTFCFGLFTNCCMAGEGGKFDW